MSKAYFNESQKFTQLWILMIILVSLGAWGYAVIYSIFFEKETGKAFPDLELILVSIIPLAIVFLLIKLRLTTRIRQEGIYYRFFPFHLKEKHIRPGDILSYEVRKYKPIAEYGGWGLRTGGKKYGKAVNVSGNMGLQLYLKDGKKLLIGTQMPAEISRAMQAMMQTGQTEIGGA